VGAAAHQAFRDLPSRVSPADLAEAERTRVAHAAKLDAGSPQWRQVHAMIINGVTATAPA
jgi:hypothetical protein